MVDEVEGVVAVAEAAEAVLRALAAAVDEEVVETLEAPVPRAVEAEERQHLPLMAAAGMVPAPADGVHGMAGGQARHRAVLPVIHRAAPRLIQ